MNSPVPNYSTSAGAIPYMLSAFNNENYRFWPIAALYLHCFHEHTSTHITDEVDRHLGITSHHVTSQDCLLM